MAREIGRHRNTAALSRWHCIRIANPQYGPMYTVRAILFSGFVILHFSCGTQIGTATLLEADSVLTDKQAPVIIAPVSVGGGRAPNLKTTLLWATKIPARYYQVEVASDSAFQNPINGSPFKVSAPATELAITLPDPVRYYWRVRTNYNSSGVWSNGYFDAMDSSVYVYCPGASATCDDSGQAGNKSHPFRTIGGAMSYARTATVSDILVATRESGATYTDALIVIPGVNLKGAYTSTFLEADRNLGSNQTKVSYSGTVLFALNITQATTVQGFNMIATATTSNIALITGSNNNLTLQNNRIETSASQPGPSYGLMIQNSGTTHANGPLITSNVLLSGNVTTPSSITAALRLENSSLTVRNNYIKSGTIVQGIANFPSLAAGMLVVISDPLVFNNVIVANSVTTAGADSWSIGTYLYPANGGTFSNNTTATLSANGNAYAMALNGGTTKPIITNNIFFNASGGRVFYEWVSTDNPVSLHNNAFVGGGVVYRDNGAVDRADGDINTAGLTNQGAAATVSGNLRTAVACAPFVNYASDDYRLQQNTCTTNEWRDLRYGGRNTSLSNCGTGASSCGAVTTDLNAVTRTAVNTGSSPLTNAAGYSMGAYEQD